jgi:hypothetical protein
MATVPTATGAAAIAATAGLRTSSWEVSALDTLTAGTAAVTTGAAATTGAAWAMVYVITPGFNNVVS